MYSGSPAMQNGSYGHSEITPAQSLITSFRSHKGLYTFSSRLGWEPRAWLLARFYFKCAWVNGTSVAEWLRVVPGLIDFEFRGRVAGLLFVLVVLVLKGASVWGEEKINYFSCVKLGKT